jgi:hypothetical protein
MESDENKGTIGITVGPKISKEQREKYIKMKEFVQKNYGKNKRFNLMPHLDLVATHLHFLMVL